ncbi:MAG: VCBS repeat-containing protein [Planctomycetota bacterium]
MSFPAHRLLRAARRWLSHRAAEEGSEHIDQHPSIEPLEPRVLFDGSGAVDGDGLGKIEDLWFETTEIRGLQGYYASGSGAPTVVDDFNNDGVLDLTNGVATLLGRGDGTFDEPIDTGYGITVDSPDVWLTLDVNQDGNVDVLYSQSFGLLGSAPYGITLALGNGDGTFSDGGILPATTDAPVDDLVSGDFNQDGNPDVVAAVNATGSSNTHEDDSLNIFFGNPDGTLAPAAELKIEGSGRYISELLVSDLNEDGVDDLVILGTNDRLLLSSPDGALIIEREIDLSVSNIVQGDFNGDGYVDFAGSAYESARRQSFGVVRLGKGDGTFHEPSQFDIPQSPWGLVAADFNRDGFDDLGIGDHYSQGMWFMLGGDDASAYRVDLTIPSVRDAGASFFAADFDNDGDLDLFNLGIEAPYANLLLSKTEPLPFVPVDDGTRSLGFGQADRLGHGRYYSHVANDLPIAVDVNGDGLIDLTDGGSVWHGQGDGTFAEPEPFYAGAHYQFIGKDQFLSADFDLDGNADFVYEQDRVDTLQQSTVEVRFGDGRGGFKQLVKYSSVLQINGLYIPSSLTAGDVDGDANPDVAAVSDGGVLVWVYQGGQRFADPTLIDMNGVTGSDVVIADFNSDGVTDLAIIDPDTGETLVRLGAGDGSFGPVNTFAGGSGATTLRTGDFNGDGVVDLLSDGGPRDTDLTVQLGRGDGSFDAPAFYDLPESPDFLEIADFDGDGADDVLAGVATHLAKDIGGGFWIRLGRPDSADSVFRPAEVYAKDIEQTGNVIVADVNQDGQPDVINWSDLTTSYSVLVNYRFTKSPVDDPPIDVEPPIDVDPPATSLPAVVIGFDKIKSEATESGKNAKFRVVREGDLSRSSNVKLKFGGKAKYGKDYKLKVSGGGKMKGKHLLIPERKRAVNVTLIPKDDKKREKNESIEIAVVQTAAVSLPVDVPSLRALFEGKIKDND